MAEPPPTTRDKEVVVQHLRRDAAASHHFVNLIGSEEPHVHDRSDLTVFILRGSVRMHFEDHVVDVGPGDVVDIPMGAFHWAENTAKEPSLAYVIYAPAFDGKDRRPAKPRARGMTPKILPSGAR